MIEAELFANSLKTIVGRFGRVDLEQPYLSKTLKHYVDRVPLTQASCEVSRFEAPSLLRDIVNCGKRYIREELLADFVPNTIATLIAQDRLLHFTETGKRDLLDKGISYAIGQKEESIQEILRGVAYSSKPDDKDRRERYQGEIKELKISREMLREQVSASRKEKDPAF